MSTLKLMLHARLVKEISPYHNNNNQGFSPWRSSELTFHALGELKKMRSVKVHQEERSQIGFPSTPVSLIYETI